MGLFWIELAAIATAGLALAAAAHAATPKKVKAAAGSKGRLK
jgi:hypothetical protein